MRGKEIEWPERERSLYFDLQARVWLLGSRGAARKRGGTEMLACHMADLVRKGTEDGAHWESCGLKLLLHPLLMRREAIVANQVDSERKRERAWTQKRSRLLFLRIATTTNVTGQSKRGRNSICAPSV